MRKFFSSLVVLLLLSGSAQAASQYKNYESLINGSFCKNRFYVEFFGGANFLESEHKEDASIKYRTGYMVAGSLGYRWCYGLRLEGEYAFRRNSVEGGSNHFQSSSYMGNVIWDMPVEDWGCTLFGMVPFVGGGVGYDFQRVHLSDSDVSTDKKGLAWQVIAGLYYPVLPNGHISLEYKFHKGKSNSLQNHSIGVGFTYTFDFRFY